MSMTYAVSSALTDEEAYLYAILQDHSGLDLAEFSWFDGSTDDGCFRAWPFQFSWWRDRSPKQIDQCGRAVGKSLSIKARMFVFPFRHPGQEAVITAPELIHLEPIINLIEDQFYSTRLGREMLQKGRSAVTHRPFMMNFRNSARLMGRIPQKDGKGVKGIHPLQLELDEAQDYPRRGWTELNATLKSGFEGSEWRAHGVTRGVRDKFYEYTQDKPGNSWKVHRMTAMHRPNWTDQEREDSIQLYGGHRDDPDYRRNILGKHGDATNPLFVVTRLYSCVDDDESSDYNTHEYVHLEISDLMVEDLGPDGDVTDLLLFPDSHRNYETTWAGMDVGFTHDPSEILVWGEYHPDVEERKAMTNRKKACPKVGLSRFKLLARISLKRVPNLKQVRIILGIIAFYRPKAFGLDKTGVGLPLFQDLLAIIREEGDFSAQAQAAADIIKGYNFSAKVIVDIDDTIEVADEDDQVKEAGIHRNVLEQSTDALRGYVDTERLWLPWDDQLLAEFEGQTFSYSKSAIDQFGRARRVFCVDEETMAYTRTGWKRHDELTGADELLTLNPTSGLSEWQPPTAVNVFPGPHKMVLIESATHSSLTTMDHRWLVERYDAHHKTRNWEWRTTDTLRGLIRVPRAAQPSDLPLVSKWTDDFVELVAWLFSEGSGDSGRLYDYKTLQFGQSTAANPLLVDRIRGLLRRLTGSGPGPIRNERHPYNEFHDEERGRYVWRLSRRVSGEVKDAAINAPTMDVRPEFLQSLTRAQLDLFIEVAFLGDGDGMTEDGLQGSKLTEVRDSGYLGRVTRCLGQGDERRLASFEMACIIAGRPVNRQKPGRGRPTKAQPEGAWRYPLSLLHASHFNPADAGKVRQHVMHLGLAWCPTTPNRTWLAMRDGKVYFTGNSEGRFHALDAARMFAMAHSQQAIEAIVGAKNENEAVIARFFQPGL